MRFYKSLYELLVPFWKHQFLESISFGCDIIDFVDVETR